VVGSRRSESREGKPEPSKDRRRQIQASARVQSLLALAAEAGRDDATSGRSANPRRVAVKADASLTQTASSRYPPGLPGIRCLDFLEVKRPGLVVSLFWPAAPRPITRPTGPSWNVRSDPLWAACFSTNLKIGLIGSKATAYPCSARTNLFPRALLASLPYQSSVAYRGVHSEATARTP
jgi:hypothetical protein